MLDLNNIDSFDANTHSLVIDFEKVRTRKVGLLHHPFHFHKLLLLIDFIDKNFVGRLGSMPVSLHVDTDEDELDSARTKRPFPTRSKVSESEVSAGLRPLKRQSVLRGNPRESF